MRRRVCVWFNLANVETPRVCGVSSFAKLNQPLVMVDYKNGVAAARRLAAAKSRINRW